MAEYIKREAVLEEFEEIDPYDYNDEFDVWLDCRLTIKNAPKADVVEVRRGRWLPQRPLAGELVACSECKTLGSPQWKWCPVCGADMRGEKNDKDRES